MSKTAQRNPIKNIVLVQYAGLAAVTFTVLFGVETAFGNMLTAANFEVMAMNVVFEGIMALGMTFVILMEASTCRSHRSSPLQRSSSRS